MVKRSRGWCFTCNNYTQDDIATCMDIDCHYIIVGFEEGENGTPHLQGYVYWKTEHSFKQVKYEFGDSFHIERQKGTKIEAFTYCMKDLDYWEKGDRPRQGHRTDLDAIHYDLKAGTPVREIWESYFSRCTQYWRSFERYTQVIRKSDYDTKLIVYDTDDIDYSMRTIYTDYKDVSTLPDHVNFLFTTQFFHPNDLLSMYYSKKYNNIFIPAGDYPESINKNISYTIEDALSKKNVFKK